MELDDLKREADALAASDDPITRLEAAVTVSRRVNALGDQLIDHYVDSARTAGCSWAQVGDALGVSRQAAQQRQKSWLGRLTGAARGGGMFRRFTANARSTVTDAQRIAHRLHHGHIGPEHVLLSVVGQGDSVAVATLAELGVSRQMVEAALEPRMAPGTASGRGHIAFTPDAKKVLETALREAMGLGHSHIGTEHVLLALTTIDPAGETLSRLGVTRDRAREAVLAVLTDRS